MLGGQDKKVEDKARSEIYPKLTEFKLSIDVMLESEHLTSSNTERNDPQLRQIPIKNR